MERLPFEKNHTETSETIVKVMFHKHSGCDNDGNGIYYWEDKTVDLEAGTVTTFTHNTSYFNYDKSEVKETVVTDARPMTEADENMVYDLLTPFIETAQKYPNMQTFKIFTPKQGYFLEGKYNKLGAFLLKKNNDYSGLHNLTMVFALKNHNMVVTLYVNRSNGYFNCTVNPIQ